MWSCLALSNNSHFLPQCSAISITLQHGCRGPTIAEAYSVLTLGLAYKRMKLKLLRKFRKCSLGKRRRSFRWKYPKENLCSGDRFLALKKNNKEILREEMGFIYTLLLFSSFFLIFYGCISPLHELISFSRVLM